MPRTNRHWLPAYLDPDGLLPKIPETRALFSRRPFLVQDFVGKAISFLRSDEIKKMGFEYHQENSLDAAVHHGSINVDLGGSHVGYVPGSGGGEFDKVWRPAKGPRMGKGGNLGYTYGA